MAEESHFRLQMNPNFASVIASHPDVQTFAFKKCEQVKARARAIFDRQALHTKKPTYPFYRLSFFIQKVASGKFVVGNDDPAAVMVEFGAHPGGGKTKALAYHPLSRALDELEGNA